MPSSDQIADSSTSYELRSLLAINLVELKSLCSLLDKADVSHDAPEKITELIEHAIGKESLFWVLEKHIMAMATVCRRRRGTALNVIRSLLDSSLDENWSSEDIAKWEEYTPIFSKLVESKIVSVAEKAASLYYDHERLWISGSLVTDMRPVFDEERVEIVAGVVTHSLKILFRDDSGTPSEFAVALDLDDLDDLIRVCKEARTKNTAAVKKFKSGSEVPVIQFGDIDEG